MAMLLYGSLHSTPPGMAGEFNLIGYASLATNENFEALVNTAALSLVKTVLSLALAILMAWIVARTDTPGRGVLEILITLPFFIPPILTATAWAMLGNAQVGTINLAWRWLSGSDGTLVDVYSYGGIVWHMMQYSTPFIFLFVVDAFRAMDPSLEESSRMSGASRWQTFWRITFGLMLPITTSAFLLSFIRGMESFESAVFFGTPVGTVSSPYHLADGYHIFRVEEEQARTPDSNQLQAITLNGPANWFADRKKTAAITRNYATDGTGLP